MSTWQDFIVDISKMLDQGADEIAISEKYSGREFEWKGNVSELKIDEEYAPGVQMDMEEKVVRLENGKYVNGNYLFLLTDETTAESWRNTKVGDEARFKTTISKGLGPFPAIRVSEYPDEPEVLILIGTKCSTKV